MIGTDLLVRVRQPQISGEIITKMSKKKLIAGRMMALISLNVKAPMRADEREDQKWEG
jgi:hypothetical protein